VASKIVCFGETLWDIFPDKELIGGAPLNVAARLSSLGVDVSLMSRVGNDVHGKGIINFMKERHLSIACLQTDLSLSTGSVDVNLNSSGSATYTISSPVAWDCIETSSEALAIVRASRAFVYGSLACRNPISRATLENLLAEAPFKVFDVNLRPPHYSKDLVIDLMKQSNLIKINDEELDIITEWLGFSNTSIDNQLNQLSAYTGAENICLTMGANGAILFARGKYYRHPGYKIQVVDTVGAGDSFLASLVHQMIQKIHPQVALDASCAMGSLVASKNGANAEVSNKEIQQIQLSNS